MKEPLLARARALGFEARVRFPGMLTGETKRKALASCSAFCLPSFAEGFSMAVLEALSAGAPTVITPGCYFPEAEAAGAAIVAQAIPENLGAALVDVLQNTDRARRMGELGRQLVQREYSWDQIAERTANAYAFAVNQSRR
jgi:glycosyltransferase involved in cell wall biosynthesis